MKVGDEGWRKGRGERDGVTAWRDTLIILDWLSLSSNVEEAGNGD